VAAVEHGAACPCDIHSCREDPAGDAGQRSHAAIHPAQQQSRWRMRACARSDGVLLWKLPRHTSITGCGPRRFRRRFRRRQRCRRRTAQLNGARARSFGWPILARYATASGARRRSLRCESMGREGARAHVLSQCSHQHAHRHCFAPSLSVRPTPTPPSPHCAFAQASLLQRGSRCCGCQRAIAP
jgi:hypothetical protein